MYYVTKKFRDSHRFAYDLEASLQIYSCFTDVEALSAFGYRSGMRMRVKATGMGHTVSSDT